MVYVISNQIPSIYPDSTDYRVIACSPGMVYVIPLILDHGSGRCLDLEEVHLGWFM